MPFLDWKERLRARTVKAAEALAGVRSRLRRVRLRRNSKNGLSSTQS